MKAIVQGPYGSPDVLSLTEVDRPRVAAAEVLVQVHASPVTQGDRRLRAGDFPGIAWLPGRLMMGLTGPRAATPGTLFAGRVTAVGRAVNRFSVGDDVFGSAPHGALAEYLTMGQDGALARMPAGLSYEEAAAVPYGAVTALVFLRDLGALEAGQRVCILGAAGGVGRMAVQLARHLGAEVTGVCGAADHALVRSLGAAQVVDYRAEDFREAGRRYDLVLDTVGASRFDRCRRALTPKGRYLSLLVTARLLLQMLTTSLLRRQRAIAGVAIGGRRELEEVRALVEAGALRPVIDRTFPLDQAAAAHAHLESGRARGTVVVTVAPRPAHRGAGEAPSGGPRAVAC